MQRKGLNKRIYVFDKIAAMKKKKKKEKTQNRKEKKNLS